MGQFKGEPATITTIKRPAQQSNYCTREEWLAMPEELTLRFVRVNLARPGFRTKELTVVTTMRDEPAVAIARLYLHRWQIELCFRDIKTTLGMELLRGKSSAIVEREVAMHLRFGGAAGVGHPRQIRPAHATLPSGKSFGDVGRDDLAQNDGRLGRNRRRMA
ncbi:transposase [Cerasicoccus maritimus]|uniref:transposase n=1 Tax=Cerasicoccus maritimus TaxID=490089 RepID=UPI0031B82F34